MLTKEEFSQECIKFYNDKNIKNLGWIYNTDDGILIKRNDIKKSKFVNIIKF